MKRTCKKAPRVLESELDSEMGSPRSVDSGYSAMRISCEYLPALSHNRPEQKTKATRRKNSRGKQASVILPIAKITSC